MDYFSSLPEGCICDILSFTSPRDVCRLAAMSQEIKLAADSDSVWERFLPSDYQEILSRSVSPIVFPTKKQLFLGLSHSHILIDDGNMSFGLDKEDGKKCYMLGSHSLSFTESDSDYCRWISINRSSYSYRHRANCRFSEVALFRNIYRLRLKGRIDSRNLSWKTTYVAYLVYQLSCPHNSIKLRASIKYVYEGLGYDDDDYSIVYLKEPSKPSPKPLNGQLPKNRSDTWKEVALGEVVCDAGNNGEVEMRLFGMDCHYWDFRLLLIVLGIELRPKVNNFCLS